MDKAQKELIGTYYRARELVQKHDYVDVDNRYQDYEITHYGLQNKLIKIMYLNSGTRKKVSFFYENPDFRKYFTPDDFFPHEITFLIGNDQEFMNYFKDYLHTLNSEQISNILTDNKTLVGHPFFIQKLGKVRSLAMQSVIRFYSNDDEMMKKFGDYYRNDVDSLNDLFGSLSALKIIALSPDILDNDELNLKPLLGNTYYHGQLIDLYYKVLVKNPEIAKHPKLRPFLGRILKDNTSESVEVSNKKKRKILDLTGYDILKEDEMWLDLFGSVVMYYKYKQPFYGTAKGIATMIESFPEIRAKSFEMLKKNAHQFSESTWEYLKTHSPTYHNILKNG